MTATLTRLFPDPSIPPADTLPFPPALPDVVRVARQGPVLHSTPQAGHDVLGVNLTRGCGLRCGFCSVRAQPSYVGDGTVHLYADTAGQLADELRHRQHPPRAVFLSPGSDPFPPLNDVQAEAASVVEVLAKHGVETWIMTRGLIRPAALDVLKVYRQRVRVTAPFVTLRRDLQRALEPLCAPPRLRLRQLVRLKDAGFTVQAALDPLLPDLTDTPENLDPLLRALAAAGVRHVTAGYLYLRDGIADNLRAALERHAWPDSVLAAYEGGPTLAAPGLAPARYLPRARRQRGYASLMALASTHGISVTISRLTNPDFVTPPPAAPKPRLHSLYRAAHQAQTAEN